jgi:uncharacterized protein YecT (DUF1311 family)
MLAIFACLTALAQDCSNPQTQTDLNLCAKAQYEKADKELNKIYQLVLTKLVKSEKEKVKNAEITWIKYRDAECEAEAKVWEGGSIVGLIKGECLTKLTKQRIQVLQEFYDSLEGRVSNPEE